jgi:hypothetical protein
MKSSRPTRVASAVLILLLSGCSHLETRLGRPLPAQPVLVAGETSLSQALAQLGPPARISAAGDGLALLYEYHRIREAQIGFNIDRPILRWIKFVGARGHLEEQTLLLVFDSGDTLLSAGRHEWERTIGGGSAAQILISLASLVDSSRLRTAHSQHGWGSGLLRPLPSALNFPHGPDSGTAGLARAAAPDAVGQRTLEMRAPAD